MSSGERSSEGTGKVGSAHSSAETQPLTLLGQLQSSMNQYSIWAGTAVPSSASRNQGDTASVHNALHKLCLGDWASF